MQGQMLGFPKSILRYRWLTHRVMVEIDSSHVASSMEMNKSYILAFFAIYKLDDCSFLYLSVTIVLLENMMPNDGRH